MDKVPDDTRKTPRKLDAIWLSAVPYLIFRCVSPVDQLGLPE